MSPSWYSNMSMNDIKASIKSNINDASRSFVAIGFYLKQVRDRELFHEDGCLDIWEFAEKEFGISKSAASRFMGINDRFSVDGNSPILLDQYKDFTSSKLSELLTLSDKQIGNVTPETTVKEIRDLKPKKVKTKKIGFSHLADDDITFEIAHELMNYYEELKVLEDSEDHYKAWFLSGYQDSYINFIIGQTKYYGDVDQERNKINVYIDCGTTTAQIDYDGDHTEINIDSVIAELKELAEEYKKESVPTSQQEARITVNALVRYSVPNTNVLKQLVGIIKNNDEEAAINEVVELMTSQSAESNFAGSWNFTRFSGFVYKNNYGDDGCISWKKYIEYIKSEFENHFTKEDACDEPTSRNVLEPEIVAESEYQEVKEPLEQPELPILKNNDQRKEWIEQYQSWPLWIDQPLTGEKYYRYDFDNGSAFVVRVSKHHPWDKGKYSKEVAYGQEEYFLLGVQDNLYKGLSKTFKESSTNKSAMIEHLKEIQKETK